MKPNNKLHDALSKISKLEYEVKQLQNYRQQQELKQLEAAGFTIDTKFFVITFPEGDPKKLLIKLRGLWPPNLKPLIDYSYSYPFGYQTTVPNWKFIQGGKSLDWFELITAKVEKEKK